MVALIIPFKAGSAPDTTFRFLAELVEKDLGQKLVVVNRPGPGGTIGVSEVLQSAPDGHAIAHRADQRGADRARGQRQRALAHRRRASRRGA